MCLLLRLTVKPAGTAGHRCAENLPLQARARGLGPVSRLHIFPRRRLGDFRKAGGLPSVQMPLFLQRAAHPPARKEFRLGILPP